MSENKTDDDAGRPVTGILEILDSTAFLRTDGYLPSPSDVHVPPSLIRRYHLRPGDELTGVAGAPTGRQKLDALLRVDSVHGGAPADAAHRPEFGKLVSLHPAERLRLETEPHLMTGRVIDLLMPVGKGQRALIVAPPKAGKTIVLQEIARAISINNPECHIMMVLVGERPEEVTDLRRSVKGEVIASTFDRPPADHTAIAELAVERAKRLAELGRDVVILLDSLTRLGRAYNLAAPSTGRTLSGGVDASALFAPKRLLGAARNLEGSGSVTMFATSLVETGSLADTLIYEEYKSTGNAELKLDRKIAGRRVFPAVDVPQSGTRREELLFTPSELVATRSLRNALHSRDNQQAIDQLLEGLRRTRSNDELLRQLVRQAA
jgi:transcription termination factor Rho